MSRASGRSSPRRGDSDRTNACVARTPAPGSSGARNSTPCAPASSSIASARSEFARTCQAFNAAALPIETWSSCPALVGIESTLAGWQRDLLSLTSAAATYCGIMKPEFKPPSVGPRREVRRNNKAGVKPPVGREEGRQAIRQAWVDEALTPPFRDVGQL